MGEEYRKALKKLSVHQRQKFLTEDWNSHVMLLQLYEKHQEMEPCFDTFCAKFCNFLKEAHQPESNENKADEPFSWNEYVKIQLQNSPIDIPANNAHESEDESESENENQAPSSHSAEACVGSSNNKGKLVDTGSTSSVKQGKCTSGVATKSEKD